MEVQLRRLGNSTGLTLPPSLMRDLGLAVGQRMILRKMPDGALLLTPKIERRKYSAAELNAQCDLQASMPADLVAWEHLVPLGNEGL